MSIIKKKVENIRHFTMISMILITKRNIKIITTSMIKMEPNLRKDLEERLIKMKRNMEMITINTEKQAMNILKKEDTRKEELNTMLLMLRNNTEALIKYLTMNLDTITKVRSQNTQMNMVENTEKVDITRKFMGMTPNIKKVTMLIRVLFMVDTTEVDIKVVTEESGVVVDTRGTMCSILHLIMAIMINNIWTAYLTKNQILLYISFLTGILYMKNICSSSGTDCLQSYF